MTWTNFGYLVVDTDVIFVPVIHGTNGSRKVGQEIVETATKKLGKETAENAAKGTVKSVNKKGIASDSYQYINFTTIVWKLSHVEQYGIK